MADGTIEFSTSLDNSDLEKQLKDAEKKIDRLKKLIENKTAERNAIAEQMQEASAEIEKATQRVESLKARLAELEASDDPLSAARMRAVNDELAKAEAELDKQLNAGVELANQYNNLGTDIEKYKGELKDAEKDHTKLGRAAQRAAAATRASFEQAATTIRAKFEGLSQQIGGMFKKAIVLSVAIAGLRALKDELAAMLEKNDKFNSSVENLKAVMRGFLAAVVDAVLPAITAVVNMLSGIFERIAGLIDSVFGSNILGAIQGQRDQASAEIQAANAEKLAKAEDKQAKSAKKLAKEQAKANKQVLGFDELNMMAAESSKDAAEATEAQAPELQNDWTKSLVPDVGMFQGVLDWFDQLKQRILNDVEGPFARIREGLQQIGTGWNEIVQGIATGDWGLVWQGIKDIVIGALKVIEGAFGAFLDWLDATTGGQFHDVFEGVKRMVHGVVEVIEGLLNGDFQKVKDGVLDIVKGFEQAFDGLMDWLDGVTGGRFHDIFEGMKEIMGGVVEFIEGVLSGDLDKAMNGILTIINGVIDTVKGIVNTAYEHLKGVVKFAFAWLKKTFPELEPIFEGAEKFILKVFDMIHGALETLLENAKKIIGGAIDFVVGLFSGDGGRIKRGLRNIFNGILGVIEGGLNGLLDGAFGLINGAIDAMNNIPMVDISHIEPPSVSIPRLAGGAVIPPNRQFMAVLGDQSYGNNLEAPESLIRQIVREESANPLALQQAIVAALMQVMPSQREGDVTMVLRVGNEELARAVSKGNASLVRRGQMKPQLSL